MHNIGKSNPNSQYHKSIDTLYDNYVTQKKVKARRKEAKKKVIVSMVITEDESSIVTVLPTFLKNGFKDTS